MLYQVFLYISCSIAELRIAFLTGYRQLKERALLCKIYRAICSKLSWSEILKVDRRFYTVWSLKGFTVCDKSKKVIRIARKSSNPTYATKLKQQKNSQNYFLYCNVILDRITKMISLAHINMHINKCIAAYWIISSLCMDYMYTVYLKTSLHFHDKKQVSRPKNCFKVSAAIFEKNLASKYSNKKTIISNTSDKCVSTLSI